MQQQKQDFLIGLFFSGLLLLTVWSFLPGLGGTFIFDDLPNLMPWSALQDIDSSSKLLTFVFSSKFLPGRPLSLLSFLVDDQSWPPGIPLLKQTNLAIHLLNVCLVFWLSLKLLAHLLPAHERRTQLLLSLVVAAAWALHPMQVSTVSYIIQRMCLLCTLLTLAGLLCFVCGREQLERDTRKALLLCSVGIGLFMPLAVLAKETGLLLCVFALLIEYFCFGKSKRLTWRLWKAVFLQLPLLLFLVYCLVSYRFFTRGFETRDFNALERLLTQGPVLLDYLQKLVFPTFNSGGLFFDNFPISRSLIQPPATLAAWLAILAVIAGAWWLRRRTPLISFGLLFFFCGHLMESSVLPLELYFEHRNYLPQLGLWLALAGVLLLVKRPFLRVASATALAGWFFLLVFITRGNAALWGDPDLQAYVWYQGNPSSLRTTLVYANSLIRNDQREELVAVLARGRHDHPASLNLLLMQRIAECYYQTQPTRFDDVPAFARQADYDSSVISVLEKLRLRDKSASQGSALCTLPDNALLAKIYHGLLANPGYATAAPVLYQYLGEIAQSQDNANAAIGYYDQAFSSGRNPIYAFRVAALLEEQGKNGEAGKYLEKTEQTLSWRDKLLNPDFPERIRAARQRTQQAANEHTAPNASTEPKESKEPTR